MESTSGIFEMKIWLSLVSLPLGVVKVEAQASTAIRIVSNFIFFSFLIAEFQRL
jgi:hypothetical protein